MTAASEDVILLDDTLTETFLTDLQSRGRTEETLKCYRNSLGKLCGFLPGRRLSHEAMRRWPEALREQGYCPSTINSAVSAANSLLAFCGRRGWQVMPAPCPRPSSPS
ncbi:MAG: site-specific integrase [Butyricicoccaceae bacterium]